MLGKNTVLLMLSLLFGVLVSCQSAGKSTQEEQPETKSQTASLRPAERIATLKGELKSLKTELANEGEYNCCIHPACNWCLLHEGECGCYDNLKAGKEVCPGCGLGWHNGNGVVQGVEAGQVKWNITHEHGEAGHEDHDDDHDH